MIRALIQYFPGALPASVVYRRTRIALEAPPFGLNPLNTLFGTSCCPDEINSDAKARLINYFRYHWGRSDHHWGDYFPLGGIGCLPFVGKTGFGAFSHHVPEDGNVLVLFGPHVGISKEGEVGKIERRGQPKASTSCGAIVG